jgi:hypothetical protein
MDEPYDPNIKYPVIDPDPGVVKGIQCFRTSDWVFVGSATAAYTIMGYFMGRSSYMHRPTAVAAGLIGLSFGICFGLQNSMGRQMGLVENQHEVELSKAA